jgi:N-glycosidase YbiA
MTSSNTSSSTSSSSGPRTNDGLAIDKFEGQYRYLSNFWAAPVELDGEVYRSVEHAYQAAKTIDLTYRKRIHEAYTPNDAKKLGRKVPLRAGWEEMKVSCMAYLVWMKFSTHDELGIKLVATGDAELIEGNWWGDVFWGVCKGQGQNMLGKILMQVRTDLRGFR